jgi:hypothetical protein
MALSENGKAGWSIDGNSISVNCKGTSFGLPSIDGRLICTASLPRVLEQPRLGWIKRKSDRFHDAWTQVESFTAGGAVHDSFHDYVYAQMGNRCLAETFAGVVKPSPSR